MFHLLLVSEDSQLPIEVRRSLAPYPVEIRSVAYSYLSESLKQERVDLLLLDIDAIREKDFLRLRALCQVTTLPLMVLTSHDGSREGVTVLKLGADRYLSKETEGALLYANIEAMLRRCRANEGRSGTVTGMLKVHDLALQMDTRVAFLNGEHLPVTGAEYSMLELLLKEAGKIVSKERLSEHALGRSLSKYDRSIDVHLSQLRKKLGPYADGSDRIKTVRGLGIQYIRQ